MKKVIKKAAFTMLVTSLAFCFSFNAFASGKFQTERLSNNATDETSNTENGYKVSFQTSFVETSDLFVICKEGNNYYTVYLDKSVDGFSGTQSLPNGRYELIKVGNSSSSTYLKENKIFEVSGAEVDVGFEVTTDEKQTASEEKDTTGKNIRPDDKEQTVPGILKDMGSEVVNNSKLNLVLLLVLVAIYGIYYHKNKPEK